MMLISYLSNYIYFNNILFDDSVIRFLDTFLVLLNLNNYIISNNKHAMFACILYISTCNNIINNNNFVMLFSITIP